MSLSLNELKAISGVSNKEIIAFVQSRYPRFDKTMLSKCNGEGYGVQLDPTIVKELYQHFAPEAARRKSDQHLWKDRITCRFKKDEYRALQQAAEANGMTLQAFVRTVIRSTLIANRYLEVKGADE